MDLLPSEEQQEIVSAVRDVLALGDVATTETPRFDPRLWSSLAELGIFGLGLSEEDGGLGLDLGEEVLVFNEFGRALTSGPLVATVVASHLAAAEGRSDIVEAILSGSARVAWAEPRNGTAVVTPAVSGAWRVFDPADATWILLATLDGVALVAADRIELRAARSADVAVPLAYASVDDVVPEVIGLDGGYWWRASALVAAYHAGIAAATRDMSAAFAKTREQFGKPIGQFQAVKHRAADMAARAEQAHFQTLYAALSSLESPDILQITAARTVAGAASLQNSADNIVNHGGMGFSAETGAQRFLLRAETFSLVAGSTRWNLEKLASMTDASW